MGRATPAPGQRGEVERGRLNLTPLLWGGSEGKGGRLQPSHQHISSVLTVKHKLHFCGEQRDSKESDSCVNPHCMLGLLGFCLSNACRLCCLQSLCAATVIAALCLVQATLLGLSLLGCFQVTVTYKGKCFSNLLFPCHVETDTEINRDTVRECSLHLPS